MTPLRFAAAVLLLSCLGAAQPPAVRGEKATAAALAKKVDLALDNVAFSDAVDALAKLTRLNINVNWESLEAAGIARTTPLRADLRGVSGAACLDTLCLLVGPGANLGWEPGEISIELTTRERLCGKTEIRQVPAFPLQVSAPKPDADAFAEGVQAAKACIQELVDRDLWEDNGGAAGKLALVGPMFAISAPPATHRKIDRLLGLLKRGMGPADWGQVFAVRGALERGKFDFKWENKPWADCFADVARTARIPVVVDALALAAMEFELNKPVTLSLSQASPYAAVKQLLAQDPSDRFICDGIAGEVAFITTRQRAGTHLVLIDVTPKALAKFQVEAKETPAQTLAVAIKKNLAHDSWVDNGGKFGALRPIAPARLACCQTLDNLWLIAQNLNIPMTLPKAAPGPILRDTPSPTPQTRPAPEKRPVAPPTATPAPTPTPPTLAPTATPEAAAKSKLNLARSYQSSGLKAKATDLYNAILSDYPNTAAAEAAREELDKLAE